MTNDESGRVHPQEEKSPDAGRDSVESAPSVEPEIRQEDSLAEAKATIEEMKKQNKLLQDNIRRAEKVSVENILSGRSPAGAEVSQEEKEIIEARRILAGTGYENDLFPVKKK